MNRTTLMIGVLSLGLSTAGVALADKGPGKFMRFFDSNQDGTVTLEEFNQASAERFARMDADGDGNMTRDEFRDYVKSRRAERKQAKFQRMDSDGDGSVSQAEYVAYKTAKAERRFAYMDKNGDGKVDQGEYASCMKKRGHHHKGRLFDKLDANGDDVVTQAESHAAWSEWFKRIDANQDNLVTQDEVMQYRKHKWGK